MTIVGIDVGGTKMEGILWSGGKILQTETMATPKSRGKFLKTVTALVKKLIGERGAREINGIGVAVAGAQDTRRGVILNSPNLKFLNNFGLRQALLKKFRVPVKMDNDANCFLRAEARFGQARGKKNVVALTLGTGVGGGVMVDGKLVRGHHGAAGELGHMIIAGNSPSLPLFSSQGGSASGGNQRGGGGEFLTLEDLVSSRGFRRQSPEKFGCFLGIALSNVVNIFDPELIILGGGVSHSAKFFLAKALREMARHTLLPKRMLPPVVISKLKHGGSLGAVALFLE